MVYYDLTTHPASTRIYKQDFLLLTEQWDTYIEPTIPLNWKCVKFERDNVNQIPTKKGIYAFFVEPRITHFPSHGYLMYIGQAGYNSNRNLQKRFRDYLNDQKIPGKERAHFKSPNRERIHFMLTAWADYLYFYYAEIDPTQIDLAQLERKLLDTFIPPFSEGGYSAEIGKIKKVAK